MGGISEAGIREAFIRVFNKLRQYENVIFAPALTQLQDLSEAMHRGDAEIARLNLEIAELAEKAHKIRSLQSAGILSEDICTARTAAVNTELTRLREARKKLLHNEENDGALEQIRDIIDLLRQQSEPLTAFDEDLFLSLADHIEVEDALRFCLHGGITITQRVEAGL